MQSDLLEAALQARVIFIMGQKDTGKTTLTRRLANALFRRGYSVGIIDADVGQSDIGPPTTIGFGIITSALKNLKDVTLQHFYFVGSISPTGHLLPMVVGTRKMLDKALACGIQKILIDTTGLVSGQLGRVLKTHKIEMVEPDLIICLQKNRECEHLLNVYTAFQKPAIFRCRPDKSCREKTSSTRQTHREKIFQRYFSQAHDITYSLTDIGISNFPPIKYIKNMTNDEFRNFLLGILNENGECFALGILRTIDIQNKTATLHTSATPQEIKGIKFSRYKMVGWK